MIGRTPGHIVAVRPLRGGANLLPPDFVAGASVSSRAMRAAVSIILDRLRGK